MNRASCLIIVIILLFAFASCDQTTEGYEIEAEVDVIIEEMAEVAEPICYKPDYPIMLMDVTFVHPTFVFLDIISDFDQGHVQYYFGDYRLEQYLDDAWRDVPILADIYVSDSPTFLFPQTSQEDRFTNWRTRHGVLGIGQYRIWKAFWYYCGCGEATSYMTYAEFAITEELDEFEIHLQDPRQYTFMAEVVGYHADDDGVAIVVSYIQLDDEQDWLHGRLHAVWLNEHIVARDIDGAAINPLDIPIGSMVSIRGFPHMLIDHGDYYDDFEFSIFSTRVIEVSNIFEMHLQDPRQYSFVGEVVGYHTGRYLDLPDEDYWDAVLIRFMFFEEYYHGHWPEGIAAVWLNQHIVARDANGAAIKPTEIPIGSVVSVRGFPHSRFDGEPREEFDFHLDGRRMIEILNLHEVHQRDTRQRTITGKVAGFHFGYFDDWFDGEKHSNAIIMQVDYDDWLHGIWLNKHVLAFDANDALINPLDIPIGSVINVRGFGHSDTGRGSTDDFQLSVFDTRLIEFVVY